MTLKRTCRQSLPINRNITITELTQVHITAVCL